MGLVIAILVTLAVAGSILWIKPSKRDLRITAIRRKAMSLGLKVRLLDEKLRESMFPWCEDYRGLALYEDHRAMRRAKRELSVIRLQNLDDLHELDRLELSASNEKLQMFKESLPKNTQAIVIFPDGVGVLWDEQGDELVVSELANTIQLIEAGL